MKMKANELSAERASERGAALVTALLISLLMLAAGGALILTTGMTASNAVDATAEGQAYYAAESGLQSTLAVLRRNVPSNPAGTTANFRNLVCGTSTNCTNSSDLSLWLPRTDGVVRLVAGEAVPAFTVKVRDAELAEGAAMPPLPYSPRYLLITSTGLGPKGARKVMEMKVDAFPFEFTARAAVAIRSNDIDSIGMLRLDLGESNPHAWNGNDNAIPAGPPLPAFAVTNTADYDAGDGFGLLTAIPPNLQGVAEAAIGGDEANVLGAQQLVKLNPANLETYLQTANNARAFLTNMRARAQSMGRLNPGDIGSEDSPKFTFVDGDLDIKGGDHGAGLLIVTGTIKQAGSSSFKGLVMALGNGRIERDGTPDSIGALIVANFQHITDANGNITGVGNFGSPYVDSAGGGNSLVGYDSEWVRKALETGGTIVLGVVEK